jgi:hypothetical protein
MPYTRNHHNSSFLGFSSSKEVASYYLMFLLLSLGPIFQERRWGDVAEGGAQVLTVLEHLDVLERHGRHRFTGEALPQDVLVLEAVEPALGGGIVRSGPPNFGQWDKCLRS